MWSKVWGGIVEWAYAQLKQDLFVLFVRLHFDLLSQLDDRFEVGVVFIFGLDQSIRYRPCTEGDEGD